jgi:ABC-type branched-subunit amino acid transport system ATPase component
VVAGLLAPTRGQVFLAGADVTAVPAHRRADRLMLAPEARSIFPSLSVEDNLSVRLSQPADRERVYERFPVLGTRKRIPAGSLSGGEQQILAIAPLLQQPPDVLIAELLLAEERARGVLDIADQVVLLELGRILWAGPRPDLQEEQLTAIYLGSAQQAVAATVLKKEDA